MIRGDALWLHRLYFGLLFFRGKQTPALKRFWSTGDVYCTTYIDHHPSNCLWLLMILADIGLGAILGMIVLQSEAPKFVAILTNPPVINPCYLPCRPHKELRFLALGRGWQGRQVTSQDKRSGFQYAIKIKSRSKPLPSDTLQPVPARCELEIWFLWLLDHFGRIKFWFNSLLMTSGDSRGRYPSVGN